MAKNKFSKYCTFFLIDDDNHSKIFIFEQNKYYIRYDDNKSICINILNSFKDIKKSYKINVIDLTNNYYNVNKSDIKKYCTILEIDDINTSRIFISEKKKICTILDMMMIGIVMNHCIIRFKWFWSYWKIWLK